MSDQTGTKGEAAALNKETLVQNNGAVAPAICSDSDKAKAAKPLTPDEQMALFENDLKENDWGHQPC